jgi:hypothetical protein
MADNSKSSCELEISNDSRLTYMRAEMRVVEQERCLLQWHGKYLSKATNAHTIEELMDHCWAMWCFLCSLWHGYITRTLHWLPQWRTWDILGAMG